MHDFIIIYLSGVFLYWIFYSILIIIHWLKSFSIHSKNIASIGLENNILTGYLQEISNRPPFIGYVFTIFGVSLFSLLSWIALLIDISMTLKGIITSFINHKPKELKDIEWRLRNYIYPPEDVIRFDLQAQELLLNRKLTDEEIETMQQQLGNRDINIDLQKALNREKSN